MRLKHETGKVITATGLIDPDVLGLVMMHEHLHSDIKDWANDELIQEEKPTTPERRQYLMESAVPLLKTAREEHGMGAYVDVTMPPWRPWPDVYQDVSAASGVAIVVATGFYREVEIGKYWVRTPEDAIWTRLRHDSEENLLEMCTREIVEGIHGTDVRAGVVKLGTSQSPLTELEKKAFRVGAKTQQATGVHITTHCTVLGADASQLTLLDDEGVDLSRVVIGHTWGHIGNPEYRGSVIEWMKRGANYLPTNMHSRDGDWTHHQSLIDGILEIFDAGLGERVLLGLDSGYCSESGAFGPMTFLPPDPWLYLYTDVIPAYLKMGLTEEHLNQMLVNNPARILPVQ